MKYIHAIRNGLKRLLTELDNTYLLGEDILDPYGGAFKATLGLSDLRVISTPVSEAGIVGLAIGMAMGGLRPIVEIMFGDFITLCADQIINGAAKYSWLYSVDIPLVIRTPMGGYRGYGPTHSQTLESIFFNIPLLRIVSPSIFHDVELELWREASETKGPLLFIENKSLYSQGLMDSEDLHGAGIYKDSTDNTLCLHWGQKSPIAIIAYGGMASRAYQAMINVFMRDELDIKLIIPLEVRPLDISAMGTYCVDTEHIIVVEESPLMFGWGAEVSCQLREGGFRGEVHRLGATQSPIPCAKRLETKVLPQVTDIENAIRHYSSQSWRE